MASSSSTSTTKLQRKHHVFLSFRGGDTRFGFISHLHAALERKNLLTFTDNDLKRGEEISGSLVKAIEDSTLAVIIFSKQYASSGWCLFELVKILECRNRGQIVIPIFYKVDPSEVRNQSGSFGDAFAELVERKALEMEEERRFRDVLKEAANISGHDSRNMVGESVFVENIVQIILKRLCSPLQKEESIVHFPPQGADVFSNTEVQQFFLNCLTEVAMRNNYNDVYSLTLKISRRRREITNWEKCDLIGRGSFASVYKGVNEDGFFFAVKEVSLNDKKRLCCLENEIALLTKLDHENIVQYFGTEKDEEKLYIFLELVSHGTVEQAYKSCPFKEYQVSQYTGQILLGLKYLHNCNVIHRDLKCSNILVNEFGRIKLADFGLSRSIEDSVPLKPGSRSSFWMAPEVANPKSVGYDFQADIWSLGCTVLEMSTGKYPQYDFKNAWDLEIAIRKGRGPVVPDSLAHHLKDFINKCLQPDPNERPTAAELLAHPFVSESSCGQPDPIELLSGEHASIIIRQLTPGNK